MPNPALRFNSYCFQAISLKKIGASAGRSIFSRKIGSLISRDFHYNLGQEQCGNQSQEKRVKKKSQITHLESCILHLFSEK